MDFLPFFKLKSFYYYYFFLFFRLYCAACGILVPQPRIKSLPSALGVPSLNQWAAREIPLLNLNFTDVSEFYLGTCLQSRLPRVHI